MLRSLLASGVSWTPLLALAFLTSPSSAQDPIFEEGSSYSPTNSQVGVQIADFTGDGIMDFVALGRYVDTLYIYAGNGDGTFSSLSSVATNGGPVSVAAVDVDSDQDLDIVTCLEGTRLVQVLLNDGSGTFTALTAFNDAGDVPQSVASGDFNDDDIPDLAIAAGGTNASGTRIFEGVGDGTFILRDSDFVGDRTSSHNLVVDDFDGDGDLDVAMALTNGKKVSIVENQGGFGFEVGAGCVPPNLTALNNITEGDFNDDGAMDLFAPNNNSHGYAVFLNDVELTCGFEVSDVIPSGWGAPLIAAVDDFDRDGNDDAAVTVGGNRFDVLLGHGDGTFEFAPTSYSVGGAGSIETADLNGDHLPDVLVGSEGGTVHVFLHVPQEIEPCIDFVENDGGLFLYEYSTLPGYQCAAIPVTPGIMAPGDEFRWILRVDEGEVNSNFGTGSRQGLTTTHTYTDFVGVGVVYDDFQLYRIVLSANGQSSTVEFPASVGSTYDLSISYDGTNANLEIVDQSGSGAVMFTDSIPFTPFDYDVFQLGLDYPGAAICGPTHFEWDEANGEIDFCVDRDTGPYLRGAVEWFGSTNCVPPVEPTACYDFNDSDENFYVFEYPTLPGYQAPGIPVTPGTMAVGDTLCFLLRVDDGEVNSEFGTGGRFGITTDVDYAGFLGVALVYDDFILYRIRLAGNQVAGADYVASVGTTYRVLITYDGTNANLELADISTNTVVHTDAIPYTPQYFDIFQAGLDYPGSDHCGPDNYRWDWENGEFDFCLDRNTGPRVEGAVDDIKTPGCGTNPPPQDDYVACYDFNESDEGLFEYEYGTLPGYICAGIPVLPYTMAPGDVIRFEFRVNEGDVPSDFGTGSRMGVTTVDDYSNFLGLGVVYDDQITYRVVLSANGQAGTRHQVDVGTTYQAEIQYDGTDAILTLTNKDTDSFVYSDSIPYSPLQYRIFQVGLDYPGQAICGSTHYWWDPILGEANFCVDRDTGPYLRGIADNVALPHCGETLPPNPCENFDLSDTRLFLYEYPTLPGYQCAGIPIGSCTPEDGQTMWFVVKVEQGDVPSDFGTGDRIGVASSTDYTPFLGVALVYDDQITYRIRFATTGYSGTDIPAEVGTAYLVRMRYADGQVQATLLDWNTLVPVHSESFAYTPQTYDTFQLGLDYPGQAICGPDHFVWNEEEGRIDFCVDRDTGPYLQGWVDDVSWFGCHLPIVTGIPTDDTSSNTLRMSAYPNPVRDSATLALRLPTAQWVNVDIYDASGRHYRQIYSGVLEAGMHSLQWDGRDDDGNRASGVFFGRLRAEDGTEVTKLIVTR
ncbi:MAG: VCBS repeat-containing protein [Candidatus Eisenbacteria bacterium]|uniref:VCBS repeat-containing protein n=1 Tax=Eiseniibacteriota bacterium TaxID=2212470 RepID=A0A956NF01_UNCEI|nr:VCBS repeat-containing protein [Candidatus Eisenbacteria bacterium]